MAVIQRLKAKLGRRARHPARCVLCKRKISRKTGNDGRPTAKNYMAGDYITVDICRQCVVDNKITTTAFIADEQMGGCKWVKAAG